MPRDRRLRSRTLTIAWLLIVSGVARAGDERPGRFGGRSREANRALFAEDHHHTSTTLDSHQDTDNNPDSRYKRISKKSLTDISGPEIFEDSEALVDSGVVRLERVKRISNLFDLFPEPITTPSNQKSRYMGRRRNSRKGFKRLFTEEVNPADENEAEYSNIFDDDAFDMPGPFINDKLLNKRKNVKDIYAEALDRKNHKRNPLDHSHHMADTRGLIKRKRDTDEDEVVEDEEGEEEEDEEEEAGDEEAEEEQEEEDAEDAEAEAETDADTQECCKDKSNNEDDYYYEDESSQDRGLGQDENQVMRPATPVLDCHGDLDDVNFDVDLQSSRAKSPIKDAAKLKIYNGDPRLFGNDVNSNMRNSQFPYGKRERLVALNNKKTISAARRSLANNNQNEYNRYESKNKNSINYKLRQRMLKEKLKAYPSPKRKLQIQKGINYHIDPFSNENEEFPKLNHANHHVDEVLCRHDLYEDSAIFNLDDKERYKRYKNEELKTLLEKLIVKVVDMQNIVSEMKSISKDQQLQIENKIRRRRARPLRPRPRRSPAEVGGPSGARAEGVETASGTATIF